MGQFALFTYLRPFLETVTHVDVSTLSLVLLTVGVAGFMGTSAIGTFLKWNFSRTMVGISILMAVIALALTFFGDDLAAVAILLGVWGLVATAAPVGWWSWLAKTLPADAEAGGGLMVAVVQLAIALGSTMGACCLTPADTAVRFRERIYLASCCVSQLFDYALAAHCGGLSHVDSKEISI